MIVNLPSLSQAPVVARSLATCEYRNVSKDGRIVCSKIIEGDNEVSPTICRGCPFRSVNCEHLRFSLSQSSPSPLVVRFNGRTEIWDDDPPELHFERAACAERVIPIPNARACVGCALRKPLNAAPEQPQRRPRTVRRAVAGGKVVAFREGSAAAAAG